MFQRYTWQIEASFVAVVLIATVLLTGAHLREWVGALAVLFTFMHGQIAERMAEAQAKLSKPTVECFRLSQSYFMAKEALWLVYFVLCQTWSALAGVFVFLLYPFWRKYYYRRYRAG